ncbi:MAG: ankyrin repeat domain-containing protein, partial [Candidatus Paceibacterota bacterium]
LKLLLKYGGDVNAEAKPKKGIVQQLKTPLIAAANSSIENVKILVEADADINYVNAQFQSPIYEACNFDKIEIIRYLIIDKKAKIDIPLIKVLETNDTLYLHNILRNLRFEIGSKDHEMKMEVVEYLKERGMNYWETPIPKRFYDLYPKEYLEKY